MRIKLRIIAFLALAAMLMGMTPALAVQSDTVTKQCEFEVTDGNAKYLTDGDIDTAWAPSDSNARLLITLPAGGAGYVAVQWQDEPVNYMLEEYDADRNKIASYDQSAYTGGIAQVMPVSASTRYVLITLVEKGQEICEISVYTPGDLPESVQKWYNEYTKCDIMLVAAYPGDEFVTFGGLLPHYAVEMAAQVQPVYMTDMGRSRKAEALDALWSLGMSNYPVFMDLKRGSVSSPEDCLKNWGGRDALVGGMVEVIRRCKPEVIVSHNAGGEDGDYRRALTGMLMQYAIDAAADPEQYPESAGVHGTWQVKKLYLHLGTEKLVDMDWSAPSEALGGLSATEAAAQAFAYYRSLNGSFAVTEGGRNDTSVYSLEYSAIGEDENGNDLFENVPGLDSGGAPAETPEPTLVPTSTPALVFSPEPTVTVQPALGEADGFSESASQVIKFVLIGLGAILLITCLQALIYHLRGRKRRKWY